MKIAEGIDSHIAICDIETLKELFDVGFYDPDTGNWIEYQVSAYKNQLFEIVKEYTCGKYDYLVTFNGINFDQQVLEWVVQEHQKWVDLKPLEICEKVHSFAQKLIDNSNYGIHLPYRESSFHIKPIDVFRILHFDNDARRTSLKWCAFMLNMDVEEMPIKHDAINLNEKDVEIVTNYRRNDIKVTEGVFNIVLGKTELPELTVAYKGKNKIQDRFDVMKETGMNCLNWSDVKIGEEWNKLNYLKLTGIVDEKKIYPEKVSHPYGKPFRTFFPKTMKFETDYFKDFVKKIGNQYVKNEKQEFHLKVGETTYTIAKGGLHSNEKNRSLRPPKGYILRDADVGGQYPWFIIKMMIHAPHLSDAIIKIAQNNVDKRPVLKELAKKLIQEGKHDEARPLMGLQEMLKLCNNGGLFGKLGQKGSFLEYPAGLLMVCLGCEIEILMLIEMMTQAGFQVVSGNTDGIVTLFPAERENEYIEICKKWEELVGNTKTGKLEYADFESLNQDSINSYIGKKIEKEGYSVKKKGRFMTDFELNKNKSNRIVPLALEAYFIRGEDPEIFIRNHKNIYDFCIAKKASGKMYYEEQWQQNGEVVTKRHKKLVRFFISNRGTILFKRGLNNEGAPMNNHVNAPTALGQPLVTYFNQFYESKDYDINYDHYILEVLERIDNIEKTNKAKKFVESKLPSQQLTLF